MKKSAKPRRCKLCMDSRHASFSRFMRTGASFAAFKERFGDICSIYCWSRHKAHIATDLEAQGEGSLAEIMDLSALRKVNRKLLVLATRSERSGRIGNALQAYTTIGRNLELLAKVSKDPTAEPQAALALPETREETFAFIRDSIAAVAAEDANFRKWLLSLAIDADRALNETSTAHRIMADKDYREKIRLLLIEADHHCAPQAPYDEMIPGAFPTSGLASPVQFEPEESEGR